MRPKTKTYRINRLVFFLAVIFLSTAGFAQDCSKFPENLKPQELINFIRYSSNLKVEDVLCKLPQSLLSQYSIEFFSETGAAQAASMDEPRVHLFNESMVLTFNGSAGQAGGDEIEMAYEDENLHQAIYTDLYLRGNSPLVRDAAKLGCLACHGSAETHNTGVRFLFNAAPVWMGFFGTNGFGGDEGFGHYYDNEKVGFANFKKLAKTHPRYKYLIDLDSKSINSSEVTYYYKDPKTGVNLMGSHQDQLLGVINLKYAFLLARFNHNRLLKLVMESPDYDKYRYAIYSSLLGCRTIHEFLPPKVQKVHLNEQFIYPFLRGTITPQMVTEAVRQARMRALIKASAANFGFTINRNQDQLQDVFTRMAKEEIPILAKFYIDSDIRQEFYGANVGYSDLRYLFEGRNNNPVSMREWSIDPKKGYYRLNNKEGVDDDEILLAPLLRKYDPVLASKPELAILEHLLTQQLNEEILAKRDDVCEELKKDSLKALSQLDTRQVNLPIEHPFHVMERNCKTCHTLGVIGAPIFDFSSQRNFEKFVTLSNGFFGKNICDRITRNEHEAGAMPRVGPMTTNEIESVLAYMKQLGIKSPSCYLKDAP